MHVSITYSSGTSGGPSIGEQVTITCALRDRMWSRSVGVAASRAGLLLPSLPAFFKNLELGVRSFLVLGLPEGIFGLNAQIAPLALQLLHAPLAAMQRTFREWQLSQASR
jgi:hypothetical protein